MNISRNLKLNTKNNMRIWHEKLIPKLCQKHLCAMWREGLGCYKIITEDKKGYRNHPATQEFENNTTALHWRLNEVRKEMLSRGYHPKELPKLKSNSMAMYFGQIKEWQTLEQQIEILKAKNCKCKL